MKSYCLRCKTHTEDRNAQVKRTKNNRYLRTSVCGRCNRKKARFVSSQSGGGIDINRVLERMKRGGEKLARQSKRKLKTVFTKAKNKWNSQRGGALARRKARTIDKIAEAASMVLSGPAPSFAKLGLKLGSSGAKALKAVVDQYRRS